MRLLILSLAVVTLFAGCTRVSVIKDPGPYDKGFRYYRPKPYLLILPGESAAPDDTPKLELSGGLDVYQKGHVVDPNAPTPPVQGGGVQPDLGDSVNLQSPLSQASFMQPSPRTGSVINQSTRKVKFSIVQMQDFSEEYSVQLNPGLGIGELNMTLEDGWNLTAVNVKTDQQTEEIISSVADAVSALGGLAGADVSRTPEVLADRYVPLGLYEAVIGRDPRGRKQFYGWRYVGFMPFSPCPIEAGGLAAGCCQDQFGPTAVYALVFESDGEKDYLAFRKIGDIDPDGVNAFAAE